MEFQAFSWKFRPLKNIFRTLENDHSIRHQSIPPLSAGRFRDPFRDPLRNPSRSPLRNCRLSRYSGALSFLPCLCDESPWLADNKEHISAWGVTDHLRNFTFHSPCAPAEARRWFFFVIFAKFTLQTCHLNISFSRIVTPGSPYRGQNWKIRKMTCLGSKKCLFWGPSWNHLNGLFGGMPESFHVS